MVLLLKRVLLGFLHCLQVILAAMLAAMQFMDKVAKSPEAESLAIRWEMWNYVVDRRFVLTVAGFIVLGLAAPLKDYLRRPTHITKAIRQIIMETMLEECFRNDKANVRITIFKEAGFWRNRWIYIRRIFTHKGGWRTATHSYLYAWDRLGKPKSKTCFRCAEKAEELCEGVAGVAWYQESNVEVPNLPDISGINLQTLNMANRRTTAAKTVRRYMREGYVPFETLKKLNRKSKHLYGNVLSDVTGQIKGVLVVDNRADGEPFADFVLNNIPYYLKILASTL